MRTPSTASSTAAGIGLSLPRAAAPWTPPPSPLGLTPGQRAVLRSLRIVLGVALLAVAGVLMAVHLWSLPGRRR
jgi:hypothetical protein